MPNVDDIIGEDDSNTVQNATEDMTENWNNPEGDFELEDDETFLDKLWTDTADKELHEYDSHPLNITGRDGNKRIARGIEGFGLDSSKAVIDIVVGFIQELQALDGGK